jgi:polyisoprenoid-binding protein YceI
MRAQLLAAATALAVVAAPAAAPAQTLDIPAGTYAVDKTHLSVLWRVSHLGLSNYVGQFDPADIEATVELDPENVENSSLSVTIPADAVLTNFPGEQDFDAEIASDMFLDAANHPAITFTSTDIVVTGENTADVTGDLTIKGVTLPVTLDVTLNGAMMHPMAGVPAFGISATGEVARSDFGVTTLVGPVADAVDILIEAEFLQAAE